MEQIGSIINQRKTITTRGKIVDLSNPLVMGILNVTPNSFYAESRCRFGYQIARRASEIVEQGAKIIDIGACSTRPGVELIDEETELKRLTKAVSIVRKRFPHAIISVDTFRSNVAKAMVNDFEVNIINDISAGSMDKLMLQTIADLRVPYVVMHMQGTPTEMQQNPNYQSVVRELMSFFTELVDSLKIMGINDVIIDPGFGFGKTIEHNYTILKNLETFLLLGLPILVGLSRKSMIYKTLNCTPKEALHGTTVLNTIALHKGAKILRVHDVKAAVDAITLVQKMNGQLEYQYE